jgi:hypothetical protein
MARWLVRAFGCALLLGTAYSLTVGGTVSAYTASLTTASSTFTAAADWTAPVTAASVIGRTTAYDTGFIHQGGSYYVYANVSDAGSPSSGIAGVSANVSAVTSGDTAAPLTAGSYVAGGTTYGYRSAALTAAGALGGGGYNYTVSATDNAGNVSTLTFPTVVDNTAPTAVDVQSTNVSGGTVGHLDQGDTLTLTYSDVMDPYSILAGWTGATTAVQVALVDGGGSASDYVVVYNTAATPAQIPLGTIYLGGTGYVTAGTGSYITYGADGSAIPSTIRQTGAAITITLGTASGSSYTNTTAAAMTWTPSSSATDIAGNAGTSTTATQSGSRHVNF